MSDKRTPLETVTVAQLAPPRGPERGPATTRRDFLQQTGRAGTVLAGAAVGSSIGFPVLLRRAEGAKRSITVTWFTGAQLDVFKKEVAEPFEKEFDCQVLVETGVATEFVAKLRAERSNPRHTVVELNEFHLNIARRERLLERLPSDVISNLKNVYPEYIREDGHGVGVSLNFISIGYHTKRVAPPPDSWNILWDPKYRGKVIIPGRAHSASNFLVIAAAALQTGKPLQEAQYLIDAAMEKLRGLKRQVLNLYVRAPLAVSQIEQETGYLLGGFYSTILYPYQDKGVPVDMAIPREGTFASLNTVSLVKGGPHADLGMALINKTLSVEFQKAHAERAVTAPVIKGVSLAEKTEQRVAYGPKRAKELGLFLSDYTFINDKSAEVTEKWDKIFLA